MQCAVLACQREIRVGDLYYALGGLGRVATCAQCATDATFTIIVNKKPVTLRRGWDHPNCARFVQRIYLSPLIPNK